MLREIESSAAAPGRKESAREGPPEGERAWPGGCAIALMAAAVMFRVEMRCCSVARSSCLVAQ